MDSTTEILASENLATPAMSSHTLLPTLLPQDEKVAASPRAEIPAFVLEFAPLVHLSRKEAFWPSSHLEHIQHCNPHPLPEPTPEIPDEIRNSFALLAESVVNNEHCHLTAKTDVRKRLLHTDWLVSTAGRPNADGLCSPSPCILITVEKEGGVLDAFWFFFYSFNYGPTVTRLHFGNHVADWEHCMVRFVDGVPQNVHLSAHADGSAYTYACLEKRGVRPVIYSAVGSHAMYPKPGKHDYSPVKVLGPADFTDRGPIWDPALNFRGFQYTPTPERTAFEAYLPQDDEFLPCLRFRGQWGDKYSVAPYGKSWYSKIGLSKFRRTLCLYSLRWSDGVSGPRDKSLDRKGMNRNSDVVFTTLADTCPEH